MPPAPTEAEIRAKRWRGKSRSGSGRAAPGCQIAFDDDDDDSDDGVGTSTPVGPYQGPCPAAAPAMLAEPRDADASRVVARSTAIADTTAKRAQSLDAARTPGVVWPATPPAPTLVPGQRIQRIKPTTIANTSNAMTAAVQRG
ncbi:MAG TPA: hypothetical protein VK698_35395 [Kofleriaceae bacterium]|nr:hypothetical protein [Kofleriaceae bacterium]